jgi:tetratricopeptide (TPR) repeat protein
MNNKKRVTLKQRIGLIILGMFLALVFLEVSLRVGGYVMLEMQRTDNVIESDNEYVILCLGESTTAELPNGQSQWPTLVDIMLNEKSNNTKYKIVNEAIPGITITELYSLLDTNLEKYNPDMVVTMIGINDYYLRLEKKNETNHIIISLKKLKTYKIFRLLKDHLTQQIYEIKKDRELENIKPNIDYAKIGRELYKEGKEEDAELMFLKALKTNPEDEGAYLWLGILYRDSGNNKKAEEMFNKAIEINPNFELSHIELGRLYILLERLEEANRTLEEAKIINKNNSDVYVSLGLLYKELNELEKAEEMFNKAIEINPKGNQAYFELGGFYWERGEVEKAEKIYELINLGDDYEGPYIILGNIYEIQSKFDQAEEILKKAIIINPKNDRVYSILGGVYEKKGELEKSEEMFKKANDLRMENYDMILYKNYQKFYTTLKKNNIKLIVMQYPLRDIQEFKNFFSEEQQKDIIFVENRDNFEKALENASYEDLFIDRFAGDFGHATIKGNKLIAENVVKTILNI